MGKHSINTDKEQVMVLVSPNGLDYTVLYRVPALDLAQKFMFHYGFKDYTTEYFELDQWQ